MTTKKAKRPLVQEAKAAFELGDAKHVFTYIERLRDLPEVNSTMFEVELSARKAMVQAELALSKARHAWRQEAGKVLAKALTTWTEKEVEVALFGERDE